MGKISISNDEFLERLHRVHNGNQAAFAKDLGVCREAIRKRLKKLDTTASAHACNQKSKNRKTNDQTLQILISIGGCNCQISISTGACATIDATDAVSIKGETIN